MDNPLIAGATERSEGRCMVLDGIVQHPEPREDIHVVATSFLGADVGAHCGAGQMTNRHDAGFIVCEYRSVYQCGSGEPHAERVDADACSAHVRNTYPEF